jgi:hypothetical protein
MASQRYDLDYNLSTCISTLNIKVTKPIDIGVYRVFAENIVGTAETTCNLFIETVPNIDNTAYVNPESFKALDFPPKPISYDTDDGGDKQPILIVTPLVDQECFEGETVTFMCEVRGNPKPQVKILNLSFFLAFVNKHIKIFIILDILDKRWFSFECSSTLLHRLLF